MKLPIKNRKRRRLLVGSVIIFLIAIFLALPLIDRLGGPSEKREDQLDPFRIKFVMPERIVQLVNVQPGDTILDIGAGYGLFTFLLADASGNSGKVFATDIDQKIIDYLLNQAGEKHIDNVKPVLVSPKPDDPFYPQHTYDIIFCSDVWWGIDDPYSFFKNLSKSLKPGSGRLWIISWRLHPDFTIEEFGDFSAMLGALRFQENASLVWDRLSPDVRKALTDKKNNSVSPSLQKLFVDELNRILTDPTLYPEALRSFADETIISNSNKIRVAKHLAHDLEKAGVFTSEKHVINSRSLKMLRGLNRMIIEDVLGTEIWDRAFGPSEHSERFWREWEKDLRTGEDPLLLNNAGYELVQEHQTLPFHRVFEFKRAL